MIAKTEVSYFGLSYLKANTERVKISGQRFPQYSSPDDSSMQLNFFGTTSFIALFIFLLLKVSRKSMKHSRQPVAGMLISVLWISCKTVYSKRMLNKNVIVIGTLKTCMLTEK